MLKRTEEERTAAKAKRKVKQAARHARWGGKVPPWVRETGRISLSLLRELAKLAVLTAAKQVMSGREKHEAAVADVLGTIGLETKASEELAGVVGDLVFEAYEHWADEGEID